MTPYKKPNTSEAGTGGKTRRELSKGDWKQRRRVGQADPSSPHIPQHTPAKHWGCPFGNSRHPKQPQKPTPEDAPGGDSSPSPAPRWPGGRWLWLAGCQAPRDFPPAKLEGAHGFYGLPLAQPDLVGLTPAPPNPSCSPRRYEVRAPRGAKMPRVTSNTHLPAPPEQRPPLPQPGGRRRRRKLPLTL